MRNTPLSRLGFAMAAVGGSLALLQSQTTIFDAIAESALIKLTGGLLMIAGSILVSIVSLEQRSPSA